MYTKSHAVCTGFNKACQELKVHQQLLEEREREMQEQGSTSKQAVDEDEEEKGDDSMDWEEEVEEEVDMRKVTSTSVDVKRQQNSSSPKVSCSWYQELYIQSHIYQSSTKTFYLPQSQFCKR